MIAGPSRLTHRGLAAYVAAAITTLTACGGPGEFVGVSTWVELKKPSETGLTARICSDSECRESPVTPMAQEYDRFGTARTDFPPMASGPSVQVTIVVRRPDGADYYPQQTLTLHPTNQGKPDQPVNPGSRIGFVTVGPTGAREGRPQGVPY